MKKLAVLLIMLCLLLTGCAAQKTDGPWTCPSCGKEATGKFCPWCGAAKPGDIACRKCGHVVAAGSGYEFCPECGATLSLVGSYVTFGHYEQDGDTANGQEPIEWLVLDVQGGKALLLSRYGLDAKPYNTEWVDITWEKCTLRTWLNGTFLNKAFTSQEQKAILTTNVDNSSSQGYREWSTNGGNNTQDKVFLLSYAEANKYLGVTYENKENTNSRVAPTAYAIKQGAYTDSSYKTADGAAAWWWWLRSPGYGQFGAARVRTDGSLYYDYVLDASVSVRPALWINLESDIF